jgi:hypothetical protein
MELFREDGCLTDEGLRALVNEQLDELGRLEAAEHLAYCNRCLERYTALLTESVIQQPPESVQKPVMRTIWSRVMQNVYGRIAVAGVAAVLALGMWHGGVFELLFTGSKYIQTYTEQTKQEALLPTEDENSLEKDTGSVVSRFVDAWGDMLHRQADAQSDKSTDDNTTK